MPSNGKIIALSPDHPRMKYGIREFLKYSDDDLLEAVREYERWQENREFRLQYTVCAELAGSEETDSLFEVYDAVCREIARRKYYTK